MSPVDNNQTASEGSIAHLVDCQDNQDYNYSVKSIMVECDVICAQVRSLQITSCHFCRTHQNTLWKGI